MLFISHISMISLKIITKCVGSVKDKYFAIPTNAIGVFIFLPLRILALLWRGERIFVFPQ